MATCSECGREFDRDRKNFRKTCGDRCLQRAKERIGNMRGGTPDPTPEEIAERAAAIRGKHYVERLLTCKPGEDRFGESGQTTGQVRAGIRVIGGHMRGLYKVYR